MDNTFKNLLDTIKKAEMSNDDRAMIFEALSIYLTDFHKLLKP